MTRAARAAEVAALAANGLNGIQIAERLGISRSYAYELLQDPDGQRVRARKDSYRQPCPNCGTLMDGSNGPFSVNRVRLCATCDIQEQKTSMVRRRQRSVEAQGRNRYSDTELLLALLAAADGARSVSTERYEKFRASAPFRMPSHLRISQRFGGWNRALERAGLQPNAPWGSGDFYARQSVGRDRCLDALRACASSMGRAPTASEYEAYARDKDVPSQCTVRNTFGSWIAAVDALDVQVAA